MIMLNVHYMHTGSVSASISVYSNDNTPGGGGGGGGQETIRIPSSLTSRLNINYLPWTLTGADLFTNRYIFIDE